MQPIIKPVGDSAVLVVFDEDINEEANRKVHALDGFLKTKPCKGIVETVPAYCTLLVHYDSVCVSFETLAADLFERVQHIGESGAGEARLIEIPTVYGGIYGPDLAFVAEMHHLSEAEVISIHSQTIYRVFMMGFTPGFPYLGMVDERIATPRQNTPRTRVPSGSVGIAGRQTGVYPIESPGGWQLIGRTPLRLFDPDRSNPCVFAPGDRVRFAACEEKELFRGD